jgi:hypothetical protein
MTRSAKRAALQICRYAARETLPGRLDGPPRRRGLEGRFRAGGILCRLLLDMARHAFDEARPVIGRDVGRRRDMQAGQPRAMPRREIEGIGDSLCARVRAIDMNKNIRDQERPRAISAILGYAVAAEHMIRADRFRAVTAQAIIRAARRRMP